MMGRAGVAWRRVALGWLLSLTAGLAGAGLASAASVPPPSPKLASELRRLAVELAPVQPPGDAASSSLDARELRRRLAIAQRELVASGGSDHWLDPFFQRQDDCKDDEARARLASDAAGALSLVAAEVDGALAATAGDVTAGAARDSVARQLLAKVLAEDELRRFPRNALAPSDLQKWLTRLLQWWNDFKPRAALPQRWLAWVSDWMLVLAFASLVAAAVWIVLGRVRIQRARTVARAARFAARDPSPREPTALEAELRTLVSAGAHRDALRLLHLATLARLRESRRVPDAPGLTHWELLGALAATRLAAPVLARFASLNGAFDVAWYGGRPVDPAAFERFHAETRRFLDEVRSSAPRGPSVPAG